MKFLFMHIFGEKKWNYNACTSHIVGTMKLSKFSSTISKSRLESFGWHLCVLWSWKSKNMTNLNFCTSWRSQVSKHLIYKFRTSNFQMPSKTSQTWLEDGATYDLYALEFHFFSTKMCINRNILTCTWSSKIGPLLKNPRCTVIEQLSHVNRIYQGYFYLVTCNISFVG